MTETVFKLEKKVKGLKEQHFNSSGYFSGNSRPGSGTYAGSGEVDLEIKQLKDRIYILEKELQTAREESFQAGYEEGRASASKEAEKQIEIAKIEMHALELKYLEAIEKMEGPLLEIARKMAVQIVQSEVELKDRQEQLILKRLRKMLYDVVDQHKVIVQINPGHISQVNNDEFRQKLQTPETMELNFVANSDLQPGEVRLNSEDFFIDGTFDAGSKALKEQLLNRKNR